MQLVNIVEQLKSQFNNLLNVNKLHFVDAFEKQLKND